MFLCSVVDMAEAGFVVFHGDDGGRGLGNRGREYFTVAQ